MSDIYFVLHTHPHGIIEFHGDPFYLTPSGGMNPPVTEGNACGTGTRLRRDSRWAPAGGQKTAEPKISILSCIATPLLIHFVTPPFQSHPAGLGFFAVSEKIAALR